MRHESLYLTDILEAADYIAEFVAGADFNSFQESEMLRSAVVQKLAVIGEAAARVPENVRVRNSHIPWPQIIAFRNILVHAYFGIDWDIVLAGGKKPMSGLAGTGRRYPEKRPLRRAGLSAVLTQSGRSLTPIQEVNRESDYEPHNKPNPRL